MSLFHAILAFILFQFDDVLLVSFMGFYLTPSRIFIFTFFLWGINRWNRVGFNKIEKLGLFSCFIFFYLLSHLMSLFDSSILFSTRASYFIFDCFLILFILLKSINNLSTRQSSVLRFLIMFLWGLNVLVYLLSIISPFFYEILYSLYDRQMYGIFLERFYFSVSLIFSTHILVFLSGNRSVFHYVLIFATILCVFGSLSFSGIISLLTFIPYFWSSLKRNLLAFIILIVSLYGVNALIKSGFSTSDEFESIDGKLAKYLSSDMVETNWRLFSSLLILKEFQSEPSFIGSGFRSNIFFLQDYIVNADDDKFASSHTLFTTIYDQGIVGFLIIIIIFGIAIRNCSRYFILSLRKEVYLHTLLFASYFIVIVHLLFYYQEYLPVFYLLPIFLQRKLRFNSNESITVHS